MNHRVNGLSIKNCAASTATYASCGHGSHGKIDPIMATKQRIIHITQQAISILYYECF
jgi:hypothetical protein